MKLLKVFPTTKAILDFISPIFKSLNKKDVTVSLFLNLEKAFDTIDVDILLLKLHQYGIRGKSNDLFKSYFSIRQQYVYVNEAASEHRDISVGLG